MLNLRNFKKIYRQLQEKDTQSMAIFSLYEDMPVSFELFLQELKKETDLKSKMEMIMLYNQLTKENQTALIQGLIRKDFLSLELIFGHLIAFVFQKEPYDVAQHLDTYLSQILKRLDKTIIEAGNSEAILKEINYKITQNFIIDNSFLGYYDVTEVKYQHIISQYTLSILIILLAERIELPIFGLPYSDKLVLCYAQSYCSHSELVREDDILYYLVIGEKDLIYTLDDLKLLAMLQDETLELRSILPSSNHKLAESWIEHLSQCNFDTKTQNHLSSIYQQIFSLAEEI